MVSNPHVLIIGAGVTGLLVAQGLKKAGIDFSIFESDESSSGRRKGNWSISAHWSLPCFEDLLPPELHSRLYTATVDPFYHRNVPETAVVPMVHGETGETIFDIPLPKLVRFSRKNVRVLLSEGIEVQYAKRLNDIHVTDNGITISFADRTTAGGTIVVGCDGARSTVRRFLYPEDEAAAAALNAQYTGIRTLVKFPSAEQALKARSMSPIASIIIHPLGIFGFLTILDVPDEDKPENWTFQLMMTWPDPNCASTDFDSALEQLRQKTDDFGGVYGLASRWTFEPPSNADPSLIREKIKLAYWDPSVKRWNNHGGRITLCGDSAHPMTFHRGQGLNHSVKDALNFVEFVKKVVSGGKGLEGQSQLKQEMDNYEEEMIARGGKEVRVSKENTEMVHDWGRLMESPIVKYGSQPSRV